MCWKRFTWRWRTNFQNLTTLLFWLWMQYVSFSTICFLKMNQSASTKRDFWESSREQHWPVATSGGFLLATIGQRHAHIAVLTPCYHFRLEHGCHTFGSSNHDGAAITRTYTIAKGAVTRCNFVACNSCMQQSCTVWRHLYELRLASKCIRNCSMCCIVLLAKAKGKYEMWAA